jgi:hypothetical protein
MQKKTPNLQKLRNDVHLALSSMSIETSKSEKFLQLNDIDNGVVIFSSYINLKCLCDVDDVFMDGVINSHFPISDSLSLYSLLRPRDCIFLHQD